MTTILQETDLDRRIMGASIQQYDQNGRLPLALEMAALAGYDISTGPQLHNTTKSTCRYHAAEPLLQKLR